MESHYWNVTKILIAASSSLIAASILQSYFYRRKCFAFFHELGIPGPKPNLLKGNGDKIRNNRLLPLDVMDEWHNEFGDVYGYYVGLKPYVVIHDLDLIHQILVKDFHNYVNRPALGIDIRPVMHTLVGLRGHRWKEVRKVISPTFSMAKMKRISHIIDRNVDVLIQVVDSKVNAQQDIDFYSLFQGLTCQVIGECALATVVDCQRNPEDEFLNAIRNFLLQANNPIIDLAIYFPLVKQLLALVCRFASPCGQFTQSIIDKVKNVIDQRRNDPLANKYNDVLQLLLDASDNRGQHSDSESDSSGSGTLNGLPPQKLLSDEEIVANAWVFLLGGFETTANALTYCSYLIGTHADIQERLYQELQEYFTEDEAVTYNKIVHLPYLDQIFSEALRLYPPVVMFVTREAGQDTQLGPYHIPSGTNIQIPVWQIHHDPNLWPDPYRFDPDRFDPELRKNIHPMAWIPFGSGPRNCLGMRFALLEAKIALARLFLKYRLVPCSRTEEKITVTVPTVTLNPKNGVWLRAELR